MYTREECTFYSHTPWPILGKPSSLSLWAWVLQYQRFFQYQTLVTWCQVASRQQVTAWQPGIFSISCCRAATCCRGVMPYSTSPYSSLSALCNDFGKMLNKGSYSDITVTAGTKVDFPSFDKILVHLKLLTCFVVPGLISAITLLTISVWVLEH